MQNSTENKDKIKSSAENKMEYGKEDETKDEPEKDEPEKDEPKPKTDTEAENKSSFKSSSASHRINRELYYFQ